MSVVLTGLVLLLSPTIALGEENPVLGTWKLKSSIREVTATGEKYNQWGEHPIGYLNYSADGRMYAIITADSRIKPLAANPTDEQRIKLHQTMAAYAGTYRLQDDKVTHHVDISEPIREVWIHDEAFAASRLSMMRIMARRTNAATVIA